MTPTDVAAGLAALRKVMHDPEDAHQREDALYIQVLREIANGNPDAQALAAEALKAVDFDFERWYA